MIHYFNLHYEPFKIWIRPTDQKESKADTFRKKKMSKPTNQPANKTIMKRNKQKTLWNLYKCYTCEWIEFEFF